MGLDGAFLKSCVFYWYPCTPKAVPDHAAHAGAQAALTEGLKTPAPPGQLTALLGMLPPPPPEAARGRRPNAAHLEEGLSLAIMAEVTPPDRTVR